ncbi:hypothetical protein L1987_19017 [Smallanthus sonchifolius]|uniref:Uncharacterized protein n=1 Tax=Smallanthus sonchifolius TaxID=185202 RepID=A0ACB9J1R1_9ASTR|nr:hypothetical protein L1987_19017 [Smallanthus sonchifolius]
MFVIWAGGIEEDIIKCLAYRGDFSLSCAHLHSKVLNRVGSMLVPNENYCYEAPKLRSIVVGVAGLCWGGAVDSFTYG